MRRRGIGLILSPLLALLAVLLVSPATASASGGGGGVGAGPAPGAPGVLPRGGYYAPTIAPGRTWSSVLLVSNDGATAAPIIVYAADGLESVSSGAVYSDYGQPLSAAGSWLAPSAQTVVVKGDAEVKVRFSVTVPRNALPGDHLAGIVAQPKQARTSGSGHLRVLVVTRAVVGVLVRVPGPASFEVAVNKPSIERGPDQIGEVVTPITDTGRLIGRPTDTVSLKGPGGYRRTVREGVDTLLPGGTADFPVYWPDRLDGRYDITSCVSGSGLTQVVCSSSTVTVGEPTNVAGHPTRQHDGRSAPLPVWLIAVLSAAVGCGITVASMLRFRSQGQGRLLRAVSSSDAVAGSQRA